MNTFVSALITTANQPAEQAIKAEGPFDERPILWFVISRFTRWKGSVIGG
jgi:hypothetical protein